MNQGGSRSSIGVGVRFATVFAVVLLSGASSWAQNRKNSWEVFLYFGGTYGHDIPTAIQTGRIQTYRVEPDFANQLDPNGATFPSWVYTPNLGLVGGHDISTDPNSPNHPSNYPFVNDPVTQFGNPPCLNANNPPGPTEVRRATYFDECDNDQESLYLYNGQGRVTNGEIQTDESEFSLGLRAGYNITRHIEVEVDFGFGKQRVDLTQNLDPLLGVSINPSTTELAFASYGLGMSLEEARNTLAEFYQFTWANADYASLVGTLVNPATLPEHPFIYASRVGADPNYNIPRYFPFEIGCGAPPCPTPAGETFADVTGFINRVLQDPTAFRNRGDQISIDNFTVSASVNWNFNTKADSRIIPYVGAGFGRWMRNFDKPWQGTDTNFVLAQAGMRFFVNEIFAFRADARYVSYMEDSFTIEGSLSDYDLTDRTWSGFGGCVRDNRVPVPSQGQVPECDPVPPPPTYFFPELGNGGGVATAEIEAELDDFFEIRLGFDVILGGK